MKEVIWLVKTEKQRQQSTEMKTSVILMNVSAGKVKLLDMLIRTIMKL